MRVKQGVLLVLVILFGGIAAASSTETQQNAGNGSGKISAGPSVPGPGEGLDEQLLAGAVRRFGTLRFRVGGMGSYLAWSPDGKRVATPGNEVIWIWDAASGAVVEKIPSQLIVGKIHHHVSQIGFSPDGARLATSHYGHGIQIWDLATGKKLCQCRGLAFVFSKDGRSLYTGGRMTDSGNTGFCHILHQEPIRRWDTTTGKEFAPLGRGVPFAASRDGKLLAAITGELDQERKVQSIKFGNQVISLWDTANGQEVRRLPLEGAGFENGAFTSTGLCYHLSAPAGKQTDGVWLWPDKQLPRRLALNSKSLYGLVFSPDGSKLAWHENQFTHIWDMTSGKEIHRIKMLPGGFWSSLAFSPDSQRLAVGCEGAFTVWDLTTGQEVAPDEGHKGSIWSGALSRDGRLVCTAGRDGVIHLWDRQTGKILRTLTHPRNRSFSGVVFSPNDRFIAAVGDELFVWEASTGKLVREISLASNDCLACPTFSPDGKFLAAIGWNRGELVLWEMATGKKVWQVEDLGFSTSLAFSPDGKLLAVTSRGKTIRLRRVATGDLAAELPPPTEQCGNHQGLAYSSDGRVLVLSQLKTVRLWETATNSPRLDINCPIRYVETVAISPDGRLLATGDDCIRLWDVVTGKEVHCFSGHRGTVSKVVFSADGKYLLSCGSDTTAILWKVPQLPRRKEGAAAPKQLLQWWQALGKRETALAYQAQGQLAAAANGIAFLKDQLRPAKAPDPQQVAGWIRELNDDRFKIRKKAQDALEDLDDLAAPALEKALKNPPSLEANRRIRQLLDRLETLTPQQLQVLRAIEVLEWIGTPEERAVLGRLAQGAPSARITVEAQAALRRMAR
jgi:WD40 repeat protein